MMDSAGRTSLIVKTLAVGPLQCNCTILGNPINRKALIVDPGGDSEKLLKLLADLKLELVEILHTHAHLDHFLASGRMKEATGASLSLHRGPLASHPNALASFAAMMLAGAPCSHAASSGLPIAFSSHFVALAHSHHCVVVRQVTLRHFP